MSIALALQLIFAFLHGGGVKSPLLPFALATNDSKGCLSLSEVSRQLSGVEGSSPAKMQVSFARSAEKSLRYLSLSESEAAYLFRSQASKTHLPDRLSDSRLWCIAETADGTKLKMTYAREGPDDFLLIDIREASTDAIRFYEEANEATARVARPNVEIGRNIRDRFDSVAMSGSELDELFSKNADRSKDLVNQNNPSEKWFIHSNSDGAPIKIVYSYDEKSKKPFLKYIGEAPSSAVGYWKRNQQPEVETRVQVHEGKQTNFYFPRYARETVEKRNISVEDVMEAFANQKGKPVPSAHVADEKWFVARTKSGRLLNVGFKKNEASDGLEILTATEANERTEKLYQDLSTELDRSSRPYALSERRASSNGETAGLNEPIPRKTTPTDKKKAPPRSESEVPKKVNIASVQKTKLENADKRAWGLSLASKAEKQISDLPDDIQQRAGALIDDIRNNGPIRTNWKNFKKDVGGSGEYHAHIKSGHPTYVVCWRVVNKDSREIEVYYIGTHENAPYKRWTR